MPEGQEPAPAPSGQEPQAHTASTTSQTVTLSNPATSGQEPPKAEMFDAAYVKQLRDEAAATRLKLKAAEDKVKEHEQAQLSEAEKLQKAATDATARAEALAQQLRAANGNAEIAKHALAAGVKPELAQKLVTLEWDGDALKTDVKGAIADLVKANPELVAQAAANGSATNPARSGNGPDTSESAAILRHLRGGGPGPFDPETARRQGGGVFVLQKE